MSNFRQFMKQNVKAHENKRIVLSDRFVGEDGEPIAFEFRTLTSKDVDAAREAAVKRTGKRGTETDVDTTKLIHTLIEKAMVCPDLQDTELQNSYGVMGASALISEMFDAKEYAKLNSIVTDLAGFDVDDEELIKEAKN